MDLETAIEILEYHQKWRLGLGDEARYSPKEITKALDLVLNEVKKVNYPPTQKRLVGFTLRFIK